MTDQLDDIRDFLRFLRGVLGSGRAPLAHAVRTCPAYAAWLAMHERCPHCKAWVPFVPAKETRGLLALIEHRTPGGAACMGGGKRLRKTGSRRKASIQRVLEFTRLAADLVVVDAAAQGKPREFLIHE